MKPLNIFLALSLLSGVQTSDALAAKSRSKGYALVSQAQCLATVRSWVKAGAACSGMELEPSAKTHQQCRAKNGTFVGKGGKCYHEQSCLENRLPDAVSGPCCCTGG